MLGRERFIRAIHFEEPDRVPHALQFWPNTIDRWYNEGHLKVDLRRKTKLNPLESSEEYLDYRAICDYFELDMIPPWNMGSYFYKTDFSPMFPVQVLEDGGNWIIITDSWGVKQKIRKDWAATPQYLDFKVKTREDFEAIKERFDPDDPRRYAENLEERIKMTVEEGRFPIGWGFPGFFGFGRWMMGLKGLLLAFMRDKPLIHYMFDFWSRFIIKMAERALELQVDYLGIWEDMAYKHGPMISPRTFKELMVPYYKKVTGFFRRKGVDVAIVDSDGDITPLIPLWLEGGVNGFLPLEVQAGVDAVSLREEYKDKIVLFGNISLSSLRKGRKAIDEELSWKFKHLLPGGGYVASAEHHIPPNVPYENFMHYLKRVKEWGRH